MLDETELVMFRNAAAQRNVGAGGRVGVQMRDAHDVIFVPSY
jgi:hypothetical protein